MGGAVCGGKACWREDGFDFGHGETITCCGVEVRLESWGQVSMLSSIQDSGGKVGLTMPLAEERGRFCFEVLEKMHLKNGGQDEYVPFRVSLGSELLWGRGGEKRHVPRTCI